MQTPNGSKRSQGDGEADAVGVGDAQTVNWGKQERQAKTQGRETKRTCDGTAGSACRQMVGRERKHTKTKRRKWAVAACL